LEEAIVPDRLWPFAERCVEPAVPANPNAKLNAIAAAPNRRVVMFSSGQLVKSRLPATPTTMMSDRCVAAVARIE
jgi:hypothetical protein